MTKRIGGIIAGAFLSLCIAVNSIAGEIRLYDANDQFLGLYSVGESVGYSCGGASCFDQDFFSQEFFIPQYNAFAKIDYVVHYDLQVYTGGDISSFHSNLVSYNSDNCTGTPYVKFDKKLISEIGKLPPLEGYYLLDPRQLAYQVINSYLASSNECIVVLADNIPVVPLQEIQIPFSTPITLPFRLEYYDPSENLITGDVNNDGQVGVEEAIHALQVTSGLKPQP